MSTADARHFATAAVAAQTAKREALANKPKPTPKPAHAWRGLGR